MLESNIVNIRNRAFEIIFPDLINSTKYVNYLDIERVNKYFGYQNSSFFDKNTMDSAKIKFNSKFSEYLIKITCKNGQNNHIKFSVRFLYYAVACHNWTIEELSNTELYRDAYFLRQLARSENISDSVKLWVLMQ